MLFLFIPLAEELISLHSRNKVHVVGLVFEEEGKEEQFIFTITNDCQIALGSDYLRNGR